MTVLEVLGAILFVTSSGIFFSERFRKNKFLVLCAGAIAVISTYFLVQEIADRVVERRLGEKAGPTSSALGHLQQSQQPLPTIPHGVVGGTHKSSQDYDGTSPANTNPVQAPPSLSPLTSPLGRWVCTENDNWWGFWLNADGKYYEMGKGGWEDNGQSWSQNKREITIAAKDGSKTIASQIANNVIVVPHDACSSGHYVRQKCTEANTQNGACDNTVYRE